MKEKRHDDDRKRKKKKKEKKNKRHKEKERRKSSTSSASESDEWVEKVKETQKEQTRPEQSLHSSSRDDWMSMTGKLSTYTRDDIKTDRKEKEKQHIDSYNPSTSARELNPYWKSGGSGLPTATKDFRSERPFKRPDNDDDLYRKSNSKSFKQHSVDDNFYSRKLVSKSRMPFDDDYSDKEPRSTCSRMPATNCDFYKNEPTSSDFKRLDKIDDDRNSDSSRNFKTPDRGDNYSRRSDTSRKIEQPHDNSKRNHREISGSSSNWRKQQKNSEDGHEAITETKHEDSLQSQEIKSKEIFQEDQYLSDEKMNKLASKIVKAEIMGDINVVNKLKTKLEEARKYRKENPDAGKVTDHPEDIMLTSTNSRGDSRPLTKSLNAEDPRSKGGKRKAETHFGGERMKFFSNDDTHSLSQMFEQEKYGSNYDDDAQLAKIAAKHTNPNDDLEDIFIDEISKNKNKGREDEKNKQRAIQEHTKLEKSLDGCEYCIGSKNMLKHLMISCGSKVYLAVPARKSLTKGHCIITTVQHASCVTAVDEDVWEEIMNYRTALTKFFNSQDEDVVFFETAVKLHKHPHLVINCVPMPRDVGDTAPIYFKKALLECEAEWSMNKKVVDLKGKNIRKGVPKGLPYFWVDFGMDPGFAHVVEDQQLFPNNFAEEIIGGILDLDHHLWKKPQREQGDQLRKKVSEFVQLWKKFDTVSKI